MVKKYGVIIVSIAALKSSLASFLGIHYVATPYRRAAAVHAGWSQLARQDRA